MKKEHLVSAIIWFIVALIWFILLIVGIFIQESTIGLTVLRGITAVMSLVTAILNFINYRKEK